jgi:methyl acetate hydrolase
MHHAIKQAADTVLSYTIRRFGGVLGVVAMATDRNGNIYEGASGKRELGKDQPMTIDGVFALFSTTKAIYDTTVLQLVEEGKIKPSDPAKKYVPEITEVSVPTGFDVSGQPTIRPPKRERQQPKFCASLPITH